MSCGPHVLALHCSQGQTVKSLSFQPAQGGDWFLGLNVKRPGGDAKVNIPISRAELACLRTLSIVGTLLNDSAPMANRHMHFIATFYMTFIPSFFIASLAWQRTTGSCALLRSCTDDPASLSSCSCSCQCSRFLEQPTGPQALKKWLVGIP